MSTAQSQSLQSPAQLYSQAEKHLTDVMINDVIGPCAAARYYAYANLAAYEVMLHQKHPAGYVPLTGLLPNYPIKTYTTNDQVDTPLATVYALLRMGEEMLPSGYMLEEPRNQFIQEASTRLSPEVVQLSRAYADTLVKKLVRYAAQDGYVKTSGYLRYTPDTKAGSWQPTPPAYGEAYEPYWATVRPFFLDSATQFRPARPVPYSEEKGSAFYRLSKEVYDSTRAMSREQNHFSNFWDCNPFALTQKGHISFGTKKISPSGHWIGITSLACVQKNLSLEETVRWHAW
ncbi:hypothetical protein BWI97_00035 [Siphonobacter sp. BAB-5405]|nr:hypothetical protein BWI97_00035 [Siphonobacter sp. BAB-5405]